MSASSEPIAGPRLTLIEQWDWQMMAACRGVPVDTFFHPPAGTQRPSYPRIEFAKAICAQCPVIAQCRSYALTVREPYGIWGGLSEEERAEALGVKSLVYPARRQPKQQASAGRQTE